MKNNSHIFNLKVQKVEQICLFELSWGEGQRLTAQVAYPIALSQLYQDWRQAYLNFYQSSQMRGRTVGGGVAPITVDWHAELVKAESKLMYEFNRWLRSVELYDLRSQIAQGLQEPAQTVQIFLTCAPIELDRFPWEAWEVGAEFATTRTIQIIRSPLNIGAQTVTPNGKNSRRTRILAILGDDTGLNFQSERKALEKLIRIADVEFVGWQPEQTPSQVFEQITNAIGDERGWDVLFFAGHSNESDMTGGELGIAPGVSISISEISNQLSIAKKRGLQVAIFNSCSGLNIADSLIDLGFSQVVVMREPIHNRVAQEFLVQFLQAMGRHLDVYESMMEARQFLRLEKSHSHPSSYLVPSLFCHPGGKLFRIPPFRWRQRLRQILPSPVEAIALSVGLIGLISPVQEILLDGRMFLQSAYRDVTAQIPSEEAPPVALVEIDTTSISKARLPDSQLRPMNRSYLGKLLDQLRTLNASVVGIDFILDTPQRDPKFGDKDLGISVRRAVDKNMWLTFGAILESGKELGVNQSTAIAHRNWTLQGYVETDYSPFLLELPSNCDKACPISYLMALVQTAKDEITDLPQPQITGVTDLRSQLISTIKQKRHQGGNLPALSQLNKPLGLQPLIDYSIPPDRIYTKIPAWKLLENPDANKFPLIPKQVVLIAVGIDERLGMSAADPDYLPMPSAMSYWTGKTLLTGGENLAFMTHHFLKQRMIIPIPDIWMIGMALLLGLITKTFIQSKSPLNHKYRLQILAGTLGAVIIYWLLVLQIYISAAILLPWFLPSMVFLAYVLPATRRKNNA